MRWLYLLGGGICRATYDAEIRVGTKVDTSQMQKLQIQIDKATKKVEEFQNEYDELCNKQIPTEQYKKLEDSLNKSKRELEALISEEEKMESAGIAIGAPWENVLQKEADAQLKIEDIREEMQKLVEDGKAFTIGADQKEIDVAANNLSRAKSELRMLVTKQNELNGGTGKLSDNFKKIRTAANKAFNALDRGTTKVFTAIKNRAKSAFTSMNKDTAKANGLLATMKSRLSGIALSLLVFNWITKGFNAMVAGMKEGFRNLVKYSDEYNASMSALISANARLKNSLATAFAPIISIVIPYLVSFINMLSAAATKVAEFIAALTGKSVFIRATKQLKDYRKELGGTADAAKKAAGSLAAFDKLNVIRQDEDSSSGGGSDGGSGAGFEEVPVSDEMSKLAEKLKDILNKIFDPLKKAWNRVGKRVIQAWKYALDEVWKLIKDIGRDFLIMWNQEATVMMFEDILRIIMHIGYTIGNLARQFRKAWNTNEVGLHIFENIRDILAIIIHNIQVAAAYTALWAGKLDFYPLLEKFNGWLVSLKPVAEAVSGILLDFYTKVILPLGKWVLEKGIPDLLQVFIDFNNKVDWESLRKNLAELWAHLEPFAETVGEGLIIFIERVSDAIAGFLNSQELKDFLTMIADWLDRVSPEFVADSLEMIAKALIGLKIAILGFKAIESVTGVLETIKSFLGFFGVGGGAAKSAETMEEVASSAGYLSTALAGIAAVAGTYYVLSTHLEEIAESTGHSTDQARRLEERYKGLGGVATFVSDAFTTLKNGIEGYGFAADNVTGQGVALEKAMEDISSGVIYTDERMSELQERFSLTSEDMEMLRQATLDANPELRNLADSFTFLNGASVETLEEINAGLKNIENGIVPADNGTLYLTGRFGELTEATKVFFDNVSTGAISLDEYKTTLDSVSTSTEQLSTKMSGSGDKAGKNFTDSLKKGIENINKTTFGFGSDAVDGFNAGITQNKATTNKAIDDWSNDGVNAMHDGIWRFGSPSKTAEDFGKDTVTGYNQGITNSISKSVAAIKNWMKSIESTFKGIVQIMANIGKDSMSALIEGLTSRQSELQKKLEELAEKSKSVQVGAGSGNNTIKSMSSTSMPRLTTESVVLGGNPYSMRSNVNGHNMTGLSASSIKQAVSDAIRDNARTLGGDITVTVPLDGREIYHNVVKHDRVFRKSTGLSAFKGV